MTDLNDLKYTSDHEWVLIDEDPAEGVDAGGVVVGITAYAADKLGDVVFLELPEVGTAVAAGEVVGEIESTKSVGELISPVDGTVTEVNERAVEEPELLNSDPFGDGWLIKVMVAEVPGDLLSLEQYREVTGE